MAGPRRVLCIGLDGATFDNLLPWMADGTLPTLAALRERGTWGRLRSTVPPLTAPAWTSFMTGLNPGNHGIFHFLDLSDDRARARGERRLVSLSGVRAPAIWDLVAHAGGRVGLINIPMTYPPRPVNGVMLSGMLTPPGAPFAYPSQLAEELPGYRVDIDRFWGARPFARDREDGPAVDDDEVDVLIAEYADLLRMRGEVANRLLRREPWDFFMVVFTGTDRLGHYAWPYHPAAPASDAGPAAARRRAALRDYYRRLDDVLARLIEGAGPDAVAVVMSDHGMGPAWTRRVHVNEWLLRRGLLAVARRPRSRSGLDDWLLRLHIPRDRVARLARRLPGSRRALKSAGGGGGAAIDYDQSRAYYVHVYNHVGGIRVNGEPGSIEHRALRAQIASELGDLRDPETGQPVFRRIVAREEVYRGPHTPVMPDLITIADPNYAGSSRVSYLSAPVTPRFEVGIPGAHRDEGIFLAAGPGIRAHAEELPGLAIEDLAPTILHLLGCPAPEAMDGRVLDECLDPGAVVAPVRSPAGAGLGRWTDGIGGAESEEPSSDDPRLIEHLRALGYL